MNEFVELLLRGAERMGLSLPPAAADRLDAHRRILDRWADKVNLTTVRRVEDMAERLYLDSAVVCGALRPGARVHDVGSGAGFPGLVIKALRPELEVTLTEARRKRVSFLKRAAFEMGLDAGLRIRWERIGWERDLPAPDGWDEVISRATFPPPIWIEQGSPLVADGGRLWIMAGQPHGEGEAPFDLARRELPAGFQPGPRIDYTLPFCGLKRWLLTLERRRDPGD